MFVCCSIAFFLAGFYRPARSRALPAGRGTAFDGPGRPRLRREALQGEDLRETVQGCSVSAADKASPKCKYETLLAVGNGHTAVRCGSKAAARQADNCCAVTELVVPAFFFLSQVSRTCTLMGSTINNTAQTGGPLRTRGIVFPDSVCWRYFDRWGYYIDEVFVARSESVDSATEGYGRRGGGIW